MSYGNEIVDQNIDVVSDDIRTKDLFYSSSFLSLNVFKKGRLKFRTNGSGNATGIVPHKLGFAPAFFVWKLHNAEWHPTSSSNIDSNVYQQVWFPHNGGQNNWDTESPGSSSWTDKNNLYINLTGSAASTSYTFAYYIFTNPTQNNLDKNVFAGDGLAGAKISPDGTDVLDKESHSNYTSRFKPLKLNKTLSGKTSYGLPALAGDIADKTPSMGSYVDVRHGLGYPPFVLGYVRLAGSNYPSSFSMLPIFSTDSADGIRAVDDYWVDSQRIRFSSWRQAVSNSSPISNLSYSEDTITFKWIIFDENINSL